jgi:hypothetical protein
MKSRISAGYTTITVQNKTVQSDQKALFIRNHNRIKLFGSSESNELKSDYQKERICVLSSYGEEL